MAERTMAYWYDRRAAEPLTPEEVEELRGMLDRSESLKRVAASIEIRYWITQARRLLLTLDAESGG